MFHNSNIKKEFYSSTLNISLYLITFGILGLVCFYYTNLILPFNLFKSIFLMGILVLILSVIKKNMTIYFQDKIWLIIILLSLTFSHFCYLKPNPAQLMNFIAASFQFEGITFEDTTFNDTTFGYKNISETFKISIIGKRFTRKVTIDINNGKSKINTNSPIEKNISEEELILNIYKNIYEDTTGNKILLEDILKIENLDNEYYYEKNNIVLQGKLKYNNNYQFIIREKNTMF